MAFTGKYLLTKSDNFDEFLKQLGLGAFKRAIATRVYPTLNITQDGDTWTVKQESTFKNSTTSFQIGQEFDELRQDDVTVKSLVTQDGNKWHQVQKGDQEVTIVREFSDDGIKATATCNGVTSVRFYQRQK
ncbi:Fatty acid-binding protein [Halotydeus destructor]|nr:Fatty acid-binding protein [Halotydeus destructor]